MHLENSIFGSYLVIKVQKNYAVWILNFNTLGIVFSSLLIFSLSSPIVSENTNLNIWNNIQMFNITSKTHKKTRQENGNVGLVALQILYHISCKNILQFRALPSDQPNISIRNPNLQVYPAWSYTFVRSSTFLERLRSAMGALIISTLIQSSKSKGTTASFIFYRTMCCIFYKNRCKVYVLASV